MQTDITQREDNNEIRYNASPDHYNFTAGLFCIAAYTNYGSRNVLNQAFSAGPSPIKGGYRLEIDGLRAIAIISVVAFHAGVPYTSGGFVGVDVFFVISGFLITGLLFREFEKSGRIDILDFYARRVRRLLPALAVVLVATLVAGWLFLLPNGEQQDLSKSAIATAGFAANIFFWRTQTGYFAGPAEQLPLLHMWTLAVEEQFYIGWPVAMLVVGLLARNRGYSLRFSLSAALLVASIISLLASVWVTPVKTTMTFYMTPFRVWEFGVGGMLAFMSSQWTGPRISSMPGTTLSIAGMLAVLISVFGFDSGTVFPGYAALLPVLGTGAIILGVAWSPDGPVTRMLKTAPMVGIGKLSYSWYLWHWPLLAIYSAVNLGEHHLWQNLALVLIGLGLSALTYRFIEQPFRQRTIWAKASALMTVKRGAAALVSTAILAGLLWTGASYQLRNDKLQQAYATAKTEKFPFPAHCVYFKLPFTGLAPVDSCTLGGKKDSPMLVLWGDSHAFHFVPALATYAKQAGLRLLPRAMRSCKPQIISMSSSKEGAWRRSAKVCIEFNQAMIEELRQLRKQGAKHVILAAQWAVPGIWQTELGLWEEALSHVIEKITATGLSVSIFADVPNYKWNVANCIARRGIEACSQNRERALAQTAEAMITLKRIAAQFEGVHIWDPLSELCVNERCIVMRDGVVLYSDNQHLSVAGARLLAPAINRFLINRGNNNL